MHNTYSQTVQGTVQHSTYATAGK